VARALRDQGREAVVIAGGLSAWMKGGHPIDLVPLEDVVQLPNFGGRR